MNRVTIDHGQIILDGVIIASGLTLPQMAALEEWRGECISAYIELADKDELEEMQNQISKRKEELSK